MPRLEISLEGHLLVGGTQAAELGIDAATARRFHGGRWVPSIPATAVRGAVRMQLEALLIGSGQHTSRPYPDEAAPPPAAPGDDPVRRLFGQSGPLRSRTGAYEGELRFGDALPVDPGRASRALSIRTGVEIEDLRATAADQKLFFHEVAEATEDPLVFSARLDVGQATEADLRLLRAAVATTEAIGAGKAHGGGGVRIVWRDEAQRSLLRIEGDPATARRARVALRLVEPAHFGDGGPIGNHHATRLHLPGATLRGAIAFALLRNRSTEPETEEFRETFLEPGATSFGDGLPATDRDLDPVVGPVTARRPRGSDSGPVTDRLAWELARERMNRALEDNGSGLRFRSDAGERKLDPITPRPDPGLLRRSRTRVSIDRHTATAAEGRLFTIEHLEAWCQPRSGSARPVHLVAWIEKLTPRSAALLAKLDGGELLVGGRRNHGLGLVEGEIRFLAEEPGVDEECDRVDRLTSSVDALTRRLAARAGLSSLEPSRERVLLALTAISDFVPPEGGACHPLAAVAPEAGEPLRTFIAASLSGGYDQRPANHRSAPGRPPEPLKELLTAIGAGSVFVYEVPSAGLRALLEKAVPELRCGVGQRVESGCGRFEVFRPDPAEKPIPSDDDQSGEEGDESMNVEPSPDLKRWLVEKAQTIAGKTPRDRNQASQFRGLLQVTQRESEVAVLANFIRYQAARQASSRIWRPIYRDAIDVLEEIERKTDGPELRRAAIQHFFGYLVRHYVYLCAEFGKGAGGGKKGGARHAG